MSGPVSRNSGACSHTQIAVLPKGSTVPDKVPTGQLCCHFPGTKASQGLYPLNLPSLVPCVPQAFPFLPIGAEFRDHFPADQHFSYLETSWRGWAFGGHVLGCPLGWLPTEKQPFNGPQSSKPARMTADFFLHGRFSHSYGTICSIKQHLTYTLQGYRKLVRKINK